MINKVRVDRLLGYAWNELNNSPIVENGVIKKTYIGAISTFGAMVTMGSTISAVGLFQAKKNEKSEIDRNALSDVLFGIVKKELGVDDTNKTFFEYVSEKEYTQKQYTERSFKNLIEDAAVALKLAIRMRIAPDAKE